MKKKLIYLIPIALFLLYPEMRDLFFPCKGPSYCVKATQSLEHFGKKWGKTRNLTLLDVGTGSFADAEKSYWGVNFISHQNLTIEEAQPLVADLTYELLYRLYHDFVFENYADKSGLNVKPFKDEYMSFKIAFWDENTDRPLYPYLAQIRLADGDLYFHYADPKTQALQEPIIKPISSLSLPDYR